MNEEEIEEMDEYLKKSKKVLDLLDELNTKYSEAHVVLYTSIFLLTAHNNGDMNQISKTIFRLFEPKRANSIVNSLKKLIVRK